MRHANLARAPPDRALTNSDNVERERQLDEMGRASAPGRSAAALQITIGEVLSSPGYRARETIRLAQLGEPKTFSHLGDIGQSLAVAPRGAGVRFE
jgi:phosphohistidine phosphatase SixA